jgi:FkbM family methyltransferase
MSTFFPDWVRKTLILNRGIRYWNASVPAAIFRERGRAGNVALTRVGSDYGGWIVPLNQLHANSVVYSLGIGMDTSFDEAIIEKTHCTVVGCDPTPHAIEHVRQRAAQLPPTHFTFLPVAIWGEETTLKLYEPKTRGWIGSYSALNLQGTNKFIEVPARPLSAIARERGHTHIDILKMDIEGAEHKVIREILDSGIAIGWLCLEIDQPIPAKTARALVDTIIGKGYALRAVDGWNFTFEYTNINAR